MCIASWQDNGSSMGWEGGREGGREGDCQHYSKWNHSALSFAPIEEEKEHLKYQSLLQLMSLGCSY